MKVYQNGTTDKLDSKQAEKITVQTFFHKF